LERGVVEMQTSGHDYFQHAANQLRNILRMQPQNSVSNECAAASAMFSTDIVDSNVGSQLHDQFQSNSGLQLHAIMQETGLTQKQLDDSGAAAAGAIYQLLRHFLQVSTHTPSSLCPIL
jgi:hypothetical protein